MVWSPTMLTLLRCAFLPYLSHANKYALKGGFGVGMIVHRMGHSVVVHPISSWWTLMIFLVWGHVIAILGKPCL